MAAIIWTNAVLLSSGPLGTNLSQIVFEIRTFSRKWFWNVIWINGGYFVSASIYYGHLPVIKGLDMSQALYVTGHLLISICNDNLERNKSWKSLLKYVKISQRELDDKGGIYNITNTGQVSVIRAMLNTEISLAAYISIHAEGWACETVSTMKQSR